MRPILLCLMIVSFFTSCEKEENENNHGRGPVFYHDFIPDTTIHSIRYFIPNPSLSSCGDTPVPMDSSALLSIDIDGDALNDFRFGASQSAYGAGSCSIHCSHFISFINVSGFNPGDSISFYQGQGVDAPVDYDTLSNNIIDQTASWKSTATLKLGVQGCWYPASAYFDDTYIGIKHNNRFGWIHVSPINLNGLTIKASAIKTINNSPITAGQTH